MTGTSYMFNFADVKGLCLIVIAVVLGAKLLYFIVVGNADEFPYYFLGNISTYVFPIVALVFLSLFLYFAKNPIFRCVLLCLRSFG